MISVARATTKREGYICSFSHSARARVRGVCVFLLLKKRVSKFNNNTLLTSLSSLLSSLSQQQQQQERKKRERERERASCGVALVKRVVALRVLFAAFEACDESLCVCSLGFNILFRV